MRVFLGNHRWLASEKETRWRNLDEEHPERAGEHDMELEKGTASVDATIV